MNRRNRQQFSIVLGGPMGTVMADMGEQVERWTTQRRKRGEITRQSAYDMTRRLSALVAVGAGHPLDRGTIEAWLEKIGHLSPATRRAYVSTAHSFCAWLIREGLLTEDPMTLVAQVREPRTIPRTQRASGVRRLLVACRTPRERLMVLLMVEMGLRCAEVAQAEVGDFDPRRLTLLVHGKGGHERLLPVPELMGNAIQAYLDGVGWQAGPLVRAEGGGKRGGISAARVSDLVGDVFRRAGLKRAPWDGASAHSLRRTAASDVLDRCGNVTVVQALLGHASLATTQRYLRPVALGDLRAAVEGRDYESDGLPPAA